MTKQDAKGLAVALLVAAAILFIGFVLGYVHVITRSQAYCLDNGNTVVMIVDGHMYQYAASQQFYTRSALSASSAPAR